MALSYLRQCTLLRYVQYKLPAHYEKEQRGKWNFATSVLLEESEFVIASEGWTFVFVFFFFFGHDNHRWIKNKKVPYLIEGDPSDPHLIYCEDRSNWDVHLSDANHTRQCLRQSINDNLSSRPTSHYIYLWSTGGETFSCGGYFCIGLLRSGLKSLS